MGISFSSNRRTQTQTQPQRHHHHIHPSYYQPPPPPPGPTYYYPDQNYQNTPYQQHYNYQQYPPPQQQPNYYYPPPSSNPNQGWYNYGPSMGRPNLQYFRPPPSNNYGNGPWHQVRDPVPTLPPPPYVEHQSAKVVKNDVNVHKDTIKLEVDVDFPDRFLVSFVFDAHYDGSITIYYFAKEDKEHFKFTTASFVAVKPVKVPFQKGTAQRFRQPSGTGLDLGFFDLESLGKPSEDDVFPLVIYAEVHSSSQLEDDSVDDTLTECSKRVQVTQAIIEQKNDQSFQVKAIRQILWIDGVRYELRDLFGIGNASSESFNDDEPGKECVICMTEPKNTAVIPCRHLCMCSDCAKELRFQTNKCPICRQPITELIEIKINNSENDLVD